MRRAKLALIAWYLFWPATHYGLYVLPEWFFQHVLLALSVYAIIATKHDDYHTIQLEDKEAVQGPKD